MKLMYLRRQQGYSQILLIITLFILTTLSGCSNISRQDEHTLQYTKTISEQITGLLIRLEQIGKSEPDCRYENFNDDYRNIRVRLNTLALREQAKSQNSETVSQVEKLNDSIRLLAELHGNGCLSVGEIANLQKQFNTQTGAIFKLEHSKPQRLF